MLWRIVFQGPICYVLVNLKWVTDQLFTKNTTKAVHSQHRALCRKAQKSNRRCLLLYHYPYLTANLLYLSSTNFTAGWPANCQGLIITTKIAKFMGPTWGPPGSCRPQMGPCWPHEPCYQGSYSVRQHGELGNQPRKYRVKKGIPCNGRSQTHIEMIRFCIELTYTSFHAIGVSHIIYIPIISMA